MAGPVLIVAINSRYSHTAFAGRCLLANAGSSRAQLALLEFTLHESTESMLTAIVDAAPAGILISVYIWNRRQVEALVAALRARLPGLRIVLGGPEIAYDLDSLLARQAACVVTGEGEGVVAELVRGLLTGEPLPAVLAGGVADVARMALPYGEYRDTDIQSRVIYVESSRGCPCRCSFCISALDASVRRIPLERLLPQLTSLIERGARRLKFIDRSFNLLGDHAVAILDALWAQWREGMLLHLEMTPDPLSPDLQTALCRFPAGALHIEVGIQTLDRDVAQRVSRACNLDATDRVLRVLIDTVHADVHADLIAGLPGETPASFARGFDWLVARRPSELQLGILKRLHGAPIADLTEDWGLSFAASPPYAITATNTMSAAWLEQVGTMAAHWERVVNRGLFPRSAPLIWQGAPSAFASFWDFSRLLEKAAGRYGIDILQIARCLLDFLCELRGMDPALIARAILDDYLDGGRRLHPPRFLTTLASPPELEEPQMNTDTHRLR